MRLQCIPWGNITSHFLDVFSWSFLPNLKGTLAPGSVPDPYSEYGSRLSIRNSSSGQRLQSVLYVLKLLFLLGAHSTTIEQNWFRRPTLFCCGQNFLHYTPCQPVLRIWFRILLFSSLTFETPTKFFCLLLFEGKFTSFFKDKKS
jgi:hypothetical protein